MSGPVRKIRHWPCTTFIAAVLALAPAAACAWSPYTEKLVGNTSQFSIAGGVEVGGAQPRALAQRFRTGGNHDGYQIEEVRIQLTNAQPGSLPRVTLRADQSGRPGTAIEVLGGGPAVNGLNAFYSSGTRLARDTSYWIEIVNEREEAHASFSVKRTSSDAEDAGAASGWMLADGHRHSAGGATPDWSQVMDTSDALVMNVLGVVRRQTRLHVLAGRNTEGFGVSARFLVVPAVDYPIDIMYETRLEAGDTAGTDDFTAVANATVRIPARSTRRAVSIGTIDDGRDEPAEETFTIAITGYSRPDAGDTGRIGIHRGSDKGTIRDNDNPPLATLEGGDRVIAEGESAEFTVRLSRESEYSITVAVHVTDDGTTRTDYDAGPRTLEFAPLETEKTFTVTALEDGVPETGIEHVRIRLGPGTPEDGALVRTAGGTATVSIAPSAENEPLRVGLAQINYSYVEEEQATFIELTASRADIEPFMVDYEFRDSTADSPEDYRAANGTATFAPGETSVRVPFTIVDDANVEFTERFDVRLENLRGAGPGTVLQLEPSEGQVTISDFDTTRLFLDHPKVIEVHENAGSVRVTTTVASDVEYPFAIILQSLQNAQDPALPGADYVGFTDTVRFEALQRERHVDVTLIDDDEPELAEEFRVTLLRSGLESDIAIVNSSVTVRVLDDDPAIGVSGDSRSVAEPDAPGQVALRPVTLTLLAPVPERTTVDWTLMDGNREGANPPQRLDAREGEDYEARSGTAAFEPGATETTVHLPIIGDDKAELDKQLRLVLSNPSKGGIVTGLPGADAYAANTPVEFPITILDTDPRLQVSLEVPGSVTEGESLAIGARASGNHDFSISIEVEAEAGTATPGEDFPAASARTIVLAPGEREGAAASALPITDDAEPEALESFRLTARNTSQGAPLPIDVDAGAAVAIIDDDSGTAGVTALDDNGEHVLGQVVPVPEGGTNRIAFALGAAPSSPVTIGYRSRSPDPDITFGGATSHEFNALNWREPYIIEIEAGEDADTIHGETTLRLSFETDAPEYRPFRSIGNQNIQVREEDNDSDPAGTVAHVGLAPGVDDGAIIQSHRHDARHDGDTPFYVEFELDTPLQTTPGQMKTHAWMVVDGAVERAYDLDADGRRWAFRVRPYQDRQVLLTLNAGTPCGQSSSVCTSQGTPIRSTLIVAVPGPGGRPGVLPPGTGDEVVFDVEGETVNESDGSLDFTVRLSGSLTTAARVWFAALDGTAERGRDYGRTVELLTFAAGETEKTVTVPIIADESDEGSEYLRGLIIGAHGARIRTREAKGWIVNTDPMPKAWIARFGSTAASQAMDAIVERLERPAGQPGRIAPGGIALGGVAPGSGELREPVWRERERWEGNPPETMDARDWLARSRFHLGSAAATGERQWSFWGNATRGAFEGEEDSHPLHGDVTTLVTGADLRSGRWTAGIALSHSDGGGAFGDAVDVTKATLTSVHPYAGWRMSARTGLWGVLGTGRGTLEYEEGVADGVVRYGTGLDSHMAAAGMRVSLNEPDPDAGIEFAARMDVLVTRTRSERRRGLMPARADTSRVRALVEARGRGQGLTPTAEAGLRHDAGDAGRGLGIEIAAGVRYESPVHDLLVEGRAHALAAHEESDAREWGLSGTVSLNQGEPGFNLALSPAWGETPESINLWRIPAGMAVDPADEARPGATLNASVGYGMATRRIGGVLLPFAEMDLGADENPALRLGARWEGPGEATVVIALERTAEEDAAMMAAATVRW